MCLLSSICVSFLILTLILKRHTSPRLGRDRLLSELWVTASSGLLVAAWIWRFQLLLPAFPGKHWLTWGLMFVALVLSIRQAGTHLRYLESVTTFDLPQFMQHLAYHAAIFWQLGTLITVGTALITQQRPDALTLVILTYGFGLAFLLQGTTQFYLLQRTEKI